MPSGIYRATNVSATFMGYTYPGGAVFENNAPLGSCVPWVNEALFRFFISGNFATPNEPDGTLVQFYPDLSGAGTFRIFMSANPGALPFIPPSTLGTFYTNGPYDSLSWNLQFRGYSYCLACFAASAASASSNRAPFMMPSMA